MSKPPAVQLAPGSWRIARMRDFEMTARAAQRLTEVDDTTVAFTHGPHPSDKPCEHIRGSLAQHGVL